MFVILFQNISSEQGSPIELDLGPAIEAHSAKNYRKIKSVSILIH
jgi:hypothetical protein